jgi:LemA protein
MLAKLLLCAENYPQLEKSQDLENLEDALRDSEDSIAEERRKYNDVVEHFNARLAVFPNNLVASLAGLEKIDVYFPTPAPK